MRDSRGERWFVSFDADGYPEAATGAIMVANKIFWALGYWQVENYLISVTPDQLDIADTAKFTPPSGRKRPMEHARSRRRLRARASQRRRQLSRHRRARAAGTSDRRLPLLRHAARRSERRRRDLVRRSRRSQPRAGVPRSLHQPGQSYGAPSTVSTAGDRANQPAVAIAPDGSDVYVTYNAYMTTWPPNYRRRVRCSAL